EFTGRLTTNSAAFGGSATSTFTSGGFLGIGTSSPFANLSVHNLASSTQTTLFAIGSTTNVGAGTYATSTLFSVMNNGRITGLDFSLRSGTTTGALAVTGSTTVAGAFNSTLTNILGSTTLVGNSLFSNATSTSFAITSISSGSI